MTSIQWMFLILCIAAIMLYFRALQVTEGYQTQGPVQPVMGNLPKILQASYIPKDVASASTSNPDLAKPDYRDWVDARDSFTYFLEIYTPEAAATSGADPLALKSMLMNAPLYIRRIHEYILKPESIPSRDILEEAKEARQLADAVRRVGPADPYSVGWERPGCISHRNDDLMAV
jgi:hypothetical protein